MPSLRAHHRARVSRRRPSTRARSTHDARVARRSIRALRVARAPPDRRFRRRASPRVVVDAETFDFARVHARRRRAIVARPRAPSQTRKRSPLLFVRVAPRRRPPSRARRRALAPRAARDRARRRSPRARARPTDRLSRIPRAKRPSKWNQNRRTPMRRALMAFATVAEYGVRRRASSTLNSRVRASSSRDRSNARRAPRDSLNS